MVCTASLGADPVSARLARQFVATTLLSWHVEHLVDTASLLTSELVTNAVLHADSAIEVRLARETHLIRFEVEDHGDGKPIRCYPALDDTSGRGLALVDTLSSAWGVDPVSSGKSLWFELTT